MKNPMKNIDKPTRIQIKEAVMNICPTCKGKRTVTVTAHNFEKGKFVAQKPVEMKCVVCNGIGGVTDAQLKALKEYESMWCTCKVQEPVQFYDDGEHPDLRKHHYRHRTCGKVVQIG